ncbi:DegT/DnrJ/EryC1/StrS aminotransferase [Lacrimispora sp.]|uniref:DegT/DnrJ/EryC1/StrS aminotransferase n=1 Tax=Lacrimispora sp. TaxID=2719234 RepID=UPI002FDB2D5A
MKQIGGFFPYEPLLETENHFWESLCPEGGSLGFFMSGRCANYYALMDIALTDTKKTAYVPIYTCETVLDPFLKAGYELLFYDVTKDMTPIFEESALERISVINLCGYYGFCNYDRDFIRKCSEMGVIIIEDTTHSIFSGNGIDPCCDYVVGSLRKWIGVPAGGFACKRKGTFSLPVHRPEEAHLSLRRISMKGKLELMSAVSGQTDPHAMEQLNASFWDAEMMLRRIFDSYGSDEESESILRRYDFDHLKKQRRKNYQYLLDHMPGHPQLTIVFPALPDETVPSHFTVYAKDRDMVQAYLSGHGIKSTAYWPKGPMVDTAGRGEADYIYSHVLSLPCDQRYGVEEMEYICRKIQDMPF